MLKLVPLGDEYIFMIGLRKVVNLKIYDLPESKVVVKKDGEKTFGYSYKVQYFIGKGEFGSKKVDSERKNLLNPKKLNDEHLTKLVSEIIDSEESLEQSFASDGKGMMYFGEDGTKIIYYGEKKEELKNKLLARRR